VHRTAQNFSKETRRKHKTLKTKD